MYPKAAVPLPAHLRTLVLHFSEQRKVFAAARRGAESAWRDGYAYTKAGIMLDGLVTAGLRPRTLFEEGSEKRQQLMAALDAINGRFGRFTAVPAVQGFKREWRMRADMKSPASTTRIADVPLVRVS